jgi:tetratricopeptide (TPR) repeat protein
MDERLTRVKRLKDSAKVNRNFDDYNDALDDLKEAIKILKEVDEDSEVSEDSDYLAALHRELADCYGMEGGIYRRLAMKEDSRAFLEKSAEMYMKGKDYEIDDSYNLTNSVVISIMLDPGNLEKEQKTMREGIQKIQEQVRGKRRDQWWAWADLGLFNLLVDDYHAAFSAYTKFTQLGPRVQDYESTLLVLEDLRRTLQETESPLARSIALSIEKIIDVLNKAKYREKAELL